MGAYLASPNTEKSSHDEVYENLEYGVSGMQGWRMSMEDAHCAIPNFDEKKNAIFGVFDGHGGMEVAEYCAQNLHKFLLDRDAYHEGDIRLALKDTFMSIDEAITSDEVIEVLKSIGGGAVDEMDDEDEATMLLEEAHMPIEELLERIKGNVKEKLKEDGILQEDNAEEDKSEEERIANGYCDTTKNGSTGSSKSRKQKKPMKKNIEEEKTEQNSTGGPSSGDNSSGVSSKTDENSSSGTSVDDNSSSGTSVNDKSNEAISGSSSGTASESKHDEEDPDFDNDEEEEDADEEEEEEEEEGESNSDSDDEFEDSEGVEFQQGSDEVGKDSGTTAVVAVIHNSKLYVANAGDSRCVLCRNGKTLEMSFDHKPEDDVERTRIEKAGGKITMDGRVNGGLNLSRAIGDHTYKQNKNVPLEEQVISACPDIKEVDLTKDDSFMVLACDGIWNVMTNEEVIEFVHEKLQVETDEKIRLSNICEDLFDRCLAPNTDNDGSGCDNMTCMIIRFKHDSYIKQTAKQMKRTNESENGDDDHRKSKKTKLNDMDEQNV